jgi:AcrR family transcriptional regulator
MLLREAHVDPRIVRTRELLGQAFMALMSEQEFEKITVQDITARARVNRATFYAHFEDKYALMNYLMREQFQTMVRTRLPKDAEFSAENLRALILATCDFLGGFASHCKPARNFDNATIEAQVQVRLYEVLLEWIKPLNTQTLPMNITPEVITTVVSWGIFGTVSQWAHGRKKISAEQVTDQVLALLMPGLRPLLK